MKIEKRLERLEQEYFFQTRSYEASNFGEYISWPPSERNTKASSAFHSDKTRFLHTRTFLSRKAPWRVSIAAQKERPSMPSDLYFTCCLQAEMGLPWHSGDSASL